MFSLAANQRHSECLISLVRISLCTSCLVSAGRYDWKIGSGQINLDNFLLHAWTKEAGIQSAASFVSLIFLFVNAQSGLLPGCCATIEHPDIGVSLTQ